MTLRDEAERLEYLIREEIRAAEQRGRTERDQLLSILLLIRGKHAMGIFTLPEADVERIDAALSALGGSQSPQERK